MLGLVLADHDRGVAALQAQRRGTQRDAAHLLQHMGEIVLAPDALALDALGHPAGLGAGVGQQRLGQGAQQGAGCGRGGRLFGRRHGWRGLLAQGCRAAVHAAAPR